MKKVMKEMTEAVDSEEGFEFIHVPDEIMNQPRPKPDPEAFIAWRIKAMKRERLRPPTHK